MKNFIFDTNAYRSLVGSKNENETRVYFTDLVSKEKKKNHVTILSPVVFFELMSHLADETDKNYSICHKSLIGAYIHCMGIDGNPRILLDFEAHLAELLYDFKYTEAYELANKWAKILCGIYVDKTGSFLIDNIQVFKDVMTFISTEETRFIKNMKENVITPIFDSIKEDKETFINSFKSFVEKGELKRIIAFSQFVKTVNIIGKDLKDINNDEQKSKTDYIENNFGTPISLYTNLILTVVDSNGQLNIEKNKRPNLIWDFQVSFCAGRHEVNGSPITLVTDDIAIIKAAKDAGCSDSVLKLEDYLKLLD